MTLSILFVIGDLDRGGTERHLVQLLPSLAERNLKPVVYTLTHRGELAPHLEQRAIRVIGPPLSVSVRRLPRCARKVAILPLSLAGLLFVLLTNRPRIVHFFLPSAYLLGGLTTLFLPLDGRVMSRRSLRNYQSAHPWMARIERWLHPHMSAILGNSRAVIKQLREEGVAGERLGLIYNGIDMRPYRALPRRDELRDALNITEPTLVLVTVANFIPYKGHNDLLDALSRIKDEIPKPWLILFVGSGDAYEVVIRKHATALRLDKQIRYLGARDDVPNILGAADIGVLSSHEEGFSNSVLEGMAASLPMVVTDVGGNTEAIIHGENGLVVAPRDPAALADAILSLAQDGTMRKRMGQAGHRRVETLFTMDSCVTKYCTLYEALSEKRTVSVPDLLGTYTS